jgi:hypothetical protein
MNMHVAGETGLHVLNQDTDGIQLCIRRKVLKWLGVESEHLLTPTDRGTGRPARSLVTLPTEHSWLHGTHKEQLCRATVQSNSDTCRRAE